MAIFAIWRELRRGGNYSAPSQLVQAQSEFILIESSLELCPLPYLSSATNQLIHSLNKAHARRLYLHIIAMHFDCHLTNISQS